MIFEDGTSIPLNAYTSIAGCRQISNASIIKLPGGSQYTSFFEDSTGNRCKVVNRFIATNNSILWEVDIRGEGKAWTTPVETILDYPKTKNSTCWTSWSSPEKADKEWFDPFEAKPIKKWHLPMAEKEFLT
ncbi:MAG: hypothetical protein HC830_00155 [Bacteroidetes bacterium]|nr:hypothetical protein [Bacteroidota bacterium]